jgi:hypothetical protein
MGPLIDLVACIGMSRRRAKAWLSPRQGDLSTKLRLKGSLCSCNPWYEERSSCLVQYCRKGLVAGGDKQQEAMPTSLCSASSNQSSTSAYLADSSAIKSNGYHVSEVYLGRYCKLTSERLAWLVTLSWQKFCKKISAMAMLMTHISKQPTRLSSPFHSATIRSAMHIRPIDTRKTHTPWPGLKPLG